MAQFADRTRLVSHIDCAGGGQVWIDGTRLFVGHMRAPGGTSIYDVADPAHPRLLARLDVPEGWHSHKVRAQDGLMLVNHERAGRGNEDFGGGLAIYDVARPDAPRAITKWRTAGLGVHRFDFDGRFAYLSATAEGYAGYIVVILDLADPARPEEVSRWWLPGQHRAANEPYPWTSYVEPKCHHPLRVGDRLYVSYWHHGFFILDIADLARPTLVSGFNTAPVAPNPTHTCLVMPEPLLGRRIMVVADEDVAQLRPAPPAFSWVFDITDETAPVPIGTIHPDGVDRGRPQPKMTGCHQPSERFRAPVVPFAWFAQGLRLFDLSDPFAPKPVGAFVPEPASGAEAASSNDVTIDDRGLIYLVDRVGGVDIVEAEVWA